jgi:hypothetical protein
MQAARRVIARGVTLWALPVALQLSSCKRASPFAAFT